MRIVAGTAKGRALKGPKGEGLRPTADRVRESLFNILGQWLDDLTVLDLFCGTGALALEALSRGASKAVLVDNGREALKLSQENADALGFSDRARIVSGKFDAKTLALVARQGPFDLVFADPPYASFGPKEILEPLAKANLLKPGGRVVVEHDRRNEPPESVGALRLVDTRRFGDTAVSFYELSPGT